MRGRIPALGRVGSRWESPLGRGSFALMNRTMYILTCIALYSAIMLVLAWGLSQVLPGWIDWADDTLGMWTVRGLIVLLIIGAYLVAYLAGRNDSGKALDP